MIRLNGLQVDGGLLLQVTLIHDLQMGTLVSTRDLTLPGAARLGALGAIGATSLLMLISFHQRHLCQPWTCRRCDALFNDGLMDNPMSHAGAFTETLGTET